MKPVGTKGILIKCCRQGPKDHKHVTPPGAGHCSNRPQRGRTFIGFVPPGA